MGADQNFDWQRTAASALDWWRDAGVDTLVDEAPRNWLAPPPSPAEPPAAVKPVPAAEPVRTPLPATLAEFVAWRGGADAPEAGWPGAAIVAQGPADAGLMIVIDQPEREDAEAGLLLAGAPGRLFDRMLAAIGRDRDSIHLAAMCVRRPVAGRIAPEIEARLGELIRHHVALVAPRRLLLLGTAPARALLGGDTARVRGGLRALNLERGEVAETMAGTMGGTVAVASDHPRLLIDRPKDKAEAWKDLQMLIGDRDQ